MGLARFTFPHRNNLNAIVITTINPPTEAVLKYIEIAKREDKWVVIVVGDLKTPHEPYEELMRRGEIIYLSPKFQDEFFHDLSEAIGWNLSPRRSIGFLFAYQLGAKIIASVDDDNIPYANWGHNYLGRSLEVNVFKTSEPVSDPLFIVNDQGLWHRGFPIELVKERRIEYLGKKTVCPLVQASFWDGNPDIDALERLAFSSPQLICKRVKPFILANISPFNSQNTLFHRSVMKYYLLLTEVGRMDDIWGAYKMQKEIPFTVIYTEASVFQKRNKHDLFKDLQDEMYGYKYALDYIEDRHTLPKAAETLANLYMRSFDNDDIKWRMV
jgi:hypothetical protein